MPTRLCAEPGCPEAAHHRGRCIQHARANNRATHRNRSVYNSKRWQLLRRRYLFNTPLCEWAGCDEIAIDVHHRVDIQEGGLPYHMANLEALCHPHHSQITRSRQIQGAPYA